MAESASLLSVGELGKQDFVNGEKGPFPQLLPLKKSRQSLDVGWGCAYGMASSKGRKGMGFMGFSCLHALP